MLGRDTATSIFYKLHDEWLNHSLHFGLQLVVSVSRNHNIYMQVSISDVSVTVDFNTVTLTLSQILSVFYMLS